MNKLVEKVLPEGFEPNRGHCPEEAKGKRVRVILRGSWAEPRYANETRPDVAPGWAADGRYGCRWGFSRMCPEFDIVGFKVL